MWECDFTLLVLDEVRSDRRSLARNQKLYILLLYHL